MEYRMIFDEDSDALAHYGVLGMKWGVRRNRQATGAKVSRQVSKDRAKAVELRAYAYKKDKTATGGSKSAKQAKYAAKSAKYKRKSERAARLSKVYDWEAGRAAKFDQKARNYERKAQGLSGSVSKVAKANAKATKLEYKADRLERAYNKQVSKLDKKDVAKGRSSINSVLRRAS